MKGMILHMRELRQGLVTRMKAFVHDERGDTNFLSIMIILGIVLALAVIFFVFKEEIVNFVQEAIDKLFGTIRS